MANLIVRAEKEVFLATNFWQNGVASKYITNAIKELSRRAGERGTKVVVKILYDRGSPKQLLEPHYIVSEKEYTGKNVGLPAKSEIPHVDLEVMNYHDPMLGTFHSKFMIVDRKIGIVQSNNIQDNENLEMMVHFEGPIVDGMYDMALLSWHKKLDPPLPSHATPAAAGGISAFGLSHGDLFDENGKLKDWGIVIDPIMIQKRAAPYGNLAAQRYPETNKTSASTNSNGLGNSSDAAALQKNEANHEDPEANTVQPTGASDTRMHEFLKAGQQSVPDPLLGDSSKNDILSESTSKDPHYDVDIAGEIARVQRSVYHKLSPDEAPMAGVTRHLNHTVNEGFPGDADDDDIEDRMTPYIPHPSHAPFPIALVNRHPYGPPNHRSVATPQNAAWLSALRNAQKNVFIQTPTLNAEPLVPAIIEACERGIDVYCYVCLGYNDAVS
jgi:phosphatidylserine/phosphatidylglycerophosphate/cardiolipin synthase-like enzyme